MQVWEASDAPPVLDSVTLELTWPSPMSIGTLRGTVGVLKAEERAELRQGLVERAEGYALVPLSATVTGAQYVTIDGHAAMSGRWDVVGIEWRRTHLRLLLARRTDA